MITEPNLNVRKSHLQLAAGFLLAPSLLFLVYWSNQEDETKWNLSFLTSGIGLIVLGCLEVMLFELVNKNVEAINIFGILLNGLGGILYLLGTVRASGSLYWFGLHSLMAFDALILTADCSTHILFARQIWLSLWLCPLTLSSWLTFSYMLYDDNYNDNIQWWELMGKIGFGIIAISSLATLFLSCTKYLIPSITKFFNACIWFACIIVWIYFGLYIKNHVNNASQACFFIGTPFLIFSQANFLTKIGIFDKNSEVYRENIMQMENIIQMENIANAPR